MGLSKRKVMPIAVGGLERELTVVELCWEQGRSIKFALVRPVGHFTRPTDSACSLAPPGHSGLPPAHPTPQVASEVVWPWCYALRGGERSLSYSTDFQCD